MAISELVRAECRRLASNYPQPRSALLPMLHLLQSEEGMVTAEGIEVCAEILDLSTAEVNAVATFYTMYRRSSTGGEHHIGVCVNAMCGLLGGDAVYEAVARRLGVGNCESTPDGSFTLERIECQAACTHAPVMTVDWEYFDRTSVEDAMDVIDKLERGEEVQPTRGPAVRGWKASERTIAGLDDGLAQEGGGADDLMLAGLTRARELGESR
ncbi:MAG: NAD(P)H-dependent oxidoreductase subunit E [Candidatus Nanopelagicales bacterium]|nr:NAD(P)H-dependent oxidoreductase subunit E [Candidatus Nanopelagicales bacterium]